MILNRIIKRIRRALDVRLLKLSYKFPALSSIYYGCFNPSFRREHQSVLAGKVKYLNEGRLDKSNYFLLTRNTHRIEKGLLMRPKRPVFAKDYIGETIDSFEKLWSKQEMISNPQMKWFHDVLESYFESCISDEVIDLQRARFNNVVKNGNYDLCVEGMSKSIPYYRSSVSKTDIDFDRFFSLTKQRRSVRWFLDKPVPRELLDKAVLAANQSPSACNRQPYEFRFFDEPELVKKVADLPMGTKGYGDNIPVMAVLVGNLDAYFDERDRHVIYIDASLAAMSFMLALETLGLSSCAINWPDIEVREQKMTEFLKLEKHQRTILCIGIGYPDPQGKVACSEKRPLTLLRKYNYEV